jgi:hypothetical protein
MSRPPAPAKREINLRLLSDFFIFSLLLLCLAVQQLVCNCLSAVCDSKTDYRALILYIFTVSKINVKERIRSKQPPQSLPILTRPLPSFYPPITPAHAPPAHLCPQGLIYTPRIATYRLYSQIFDLFMFFGAKYGRVCSREVTQLLVYIYISPQPQPHRSFQG